LFVRTNVALLFLGNLAQTFEDFSVSFVIAVGKVEASHIHAGVHELAEAFFAPTSRSLEHSRKQ
jgi:hypothetical protein